MPSRPPREIDGMVALRGMKLDTLPKANRVMRGLK